MSRFMCGIPFIYFCHGPKLYQKCHDMRGLGFRFGFGFLSHFRPLAKGSPPPAARRLATTMITTTSVMFFNVHLLK